MDKNTATPHHSVLVMDDDESIRDLLIFALEDEGYEVFSAKDGIAGMALFKQHAIDLVITDIIMPGKEGIEIVREIKQYHPETRLIVMSGFDGIGQNDYLKYASLFGADQTFRKPFDIHEFIGCVRDLLSKK
ncbi:MAG: response regulator [Candidatus Marinimicrobia bacterium]|nr:response regulator [FCB group bacterium]MBL7025867.1 response regulator [Candidatus Neomarinimicrobiota bacterium]